MSDMVTMKAAAKELGVHYETVRRWVTAKTIPSYKVGKTVRLVMSEVREAMLKGDNDEV